MEGDRLELVGGADESPVTIGVNDNGDDDGFWLGTLDATEGTKLGFTNNGMVEG